jgi:hypothetical protein
MRSVMPWLFVAMMIASLSGCKGSVQSQARSRYNHGIDLMAQGDLEFAERAFIDARNEARGDQPLRYSTAFNLGMLHIRKADELELSEPQKALDELAQAAHWFQDAARVLSDEMDARANLQIVARKRQVLADQINQGKNGLEARLDRVIQDERALRDQIRGLMEAVKKAGAEAEPIAFRDAFASLATAERVLMADAGTISDLAGDELAGLDAQDPEQMQQQDRMRQMQLRGLDAYLQSARVAIDDARRALRKLDGARSHLRATAALAHLKRAREQLLDPVSALKGVAQDQGELLSHTSARFSLGNKQVTMPGQESQAQEIPSWLSPEHLSERQGDAIERSSEVLQRFQAAASSPPPADPASVDPQTARALEMAGKAVPFLESSVQSMEQARTSLSGDQMETAVVQETEAMRNLLRAIEYFSDLRNLIELTYAEQQGVLAMLDPELAATIPELAEMATSKRAQEAFNATERNVDRLSRMTALIQEELAQAKAQAEQQGQEAPESVQQTYDMAEQYRGAAEGKLIQAREALELLAGGGRLAKDAESPLVLAQSAQKDLEELRRIFYSIIEHLKELHRDQSETYDQTGTAQAGEDEARTEALPPLSEAQGKHTAMTEALAQALEQQADAASASEDPQAAAEAQKFAGAAAELRSALEALSAAASGLAQAEEDSASMSVDLSAVLEDQPVGIQHIEAAIALLEPPQDQEQQDQEQNQDQEQQEQEQQQQEEEVSKQQAERRLQEIRDREAERQREREKAQAVQGGGVDKDW